MFVKVLDVPYHKQEDPEKFCGPACAQMVLEAGGYSIGTQSGLFASVCNSDPANWFTNPQGLADTLSNESLHGLDGTHDDHGFGDQASAVRAICWTIAGHEQAPIALINGRKHWVVVTGCILTGEPTAPYSVIALLFQDPFDTSSAASSGTSQIELATYAYWLANQFKDKVLLVGDHYHKNWVVVGAKGARLVNVTAPPAPVGVAGPVDEEGAVSAAQEGVQQEYVLAVTQLAEALNGTAPQGAIPVAEPGSQEPIYYIVPFFDEEGGVPAAALIDARTGAFLGVRAIVNGSLGYADALALLTEGPIGQFPEGIPHPDTDEPLPLDDATIPEMPEWEPWAQTSTPYLPYWTIQFNDEQQTILYVRLDGKVFSELTPALG